MKYLILSFFIALSAVAQVPGLDGILAKAKDFGKDALAACKDDKSKIKACESYTEFAKLKPCLLENKEKLSDKCKLALKLAK
jgi:hypothetical protein